MQRILSRPDLYDTEELDQIRTPAPTKPMPNASPVGKSRIAGAPGNDPSTASTVERTQLTSAYLGNRAPRHPATEMSVSPSSKDAEPSWYMLTSPIEPSGPTMRAPPVSANRKPAKPSVPTSTRWKKYTARTP